MRADSYKDGKKRACAKKKKASVISKLVQGKDYDKVIYKDIW